MQVKMKQVMSVSLEILSIPKNNSRQCKINLRFLYWSGTETCNEIYT